MPPPYILQIFEQSLPCWQIFEKWKYYQERKRRRWFLWSRQSLGCENQPSGPAVLTVCSVWKIWEARATLWYLSHPVGVHAVFFVTHCLSAYLISSCDSLYISQPSSAHSHSLMINRAAAPASPLTATCELVTLNYSPMHRFQPQARRQSAASLVIWSSEWRRREGRVSETIFCKAARERAEQL